MPQLCSPATVEAVLYNAPAWHLGPFIIWLHSRLLWLKLTLLSSSYSPYCPKNVWLVYLLVRHSFITHILRTYHCQALKHKGKWAPIPSGQAPSPAQWSRHLWCTNDGGLFTHCCPTGSSPFLLPLWEEQKASGWEQYYSRENFYIF